MPGRTRTQTRTARSSAKKGQAARRKTSPRARAGAPSRGRSRARPGQGSGGFFHIEVRPRSEFASFRTQDVGDPGGIERVAGRRSSGSWGTVKWLVSKDYAHRVGDRLVPDTKAARELFATLGAEPKHLRGDRFAAKDRPNVPERKKPTPAQKRARKRNIRKAQAARRSAA